MRNDRLVPTVLCGLFAFSLICGFGKNQVTGGVEQRHRDEVLKVTQAQTDIVTLDGQVKEAIIKHPKYTEKLSVENLLTQLNTERALLAQAQGGRDPRPAERAVEHAELTLKGIEKEKQQMLAHIDNLNTALSDFPSTEGWIRADIQSINDRIGDFEKKGFFKRHFMDSEALAAQLTSYADKVAGLVKVIDARDNRPDYVQIWKLRSQTNGISSQAIVLASRAPDLHNSVITILKSTSTSLNEFSDTFTEAYQSAARVELYRTYRSKNFSSELRGWQNTIQGLRENLSEAERLNGMNVQDFNEANSLLQSVRERLRKGRNYVAAVVEFDQSIRDAVDHLSSYQSNALGAIRSAESLISENSQNSQGTARSTLNEARSSYNSARLKESTDPLYAKELYASAESSAEQARSEVNTYVAPPPDDDESTTSSSSSSSSSSSHSSGSSSFPSSSSSSRSGGGGYSPSASSSRSGPSGGSMGGPSSGSFGKGR